MAEPGLVMFVVNLLAAGVAYGTPLIWVTLGEVVAEAEQLGFSEIWLAEDYFELGGIAWSETGP